MDRTLYDPAQDVNTQEYVCILNYLYVEILYEIELVFTFHGELIFLITKQYM